MADVVPLTVVRIKVKISHDNLRVLLVCGGDVPLEAVAFLILAALDLL